MGDGLESPSNDAIHGSDLNPHEMRLLLECMNDGVVVVDADGAAVRANGAARRILGLDDGDAVSFERLRLNQFFQADRTTPFPRGELPLVKALLGEASDHVEMYRGADDTGDGRHISVSGRPIVDGSRVVGAVVVMQDVTQRVEEQHRLRQMASDNETRAKELNLILDCLSGGVIMADPLGRITKMNRAAHEIIGDDLSGRSLADWCSDNTLFDRDRTTPLVLEKLPLTRAIRGEATSGHELYLRREGETDGIIIGSSGRPVIDGDDIIGGLITFQDITTKIEAAKEREQLQLRLQEMQKLESVGRLAAGVAHEINTPIQYVRNNIGFLQEATGDLIPILRACVNTLQALAGSGENGDQVTAVLAMVDTADLEFLLEEIQPAIEQSIEGSNRVAEIVQAMKEFSHPGTGFQDVNVNRAIESSVLVARNEWKRAAEVTFELDPELPVIQCNPGEFNQVILNVVINAAHAIEAKRNDGAKEPGRIHIATQAYGGSVEVRISDNGTGITRDIRKKIFDPFFTTKGIGKGTGQGLAISHDVIVNRHRGTIEVESEAGRGSTFTIRLPGQNCAVSDTIDAPN